MAGPTRGVGGNSSAALEAQRAAERAREAAERARKAAEAARQKAEKAQQAAQAQQAQANRMADRMDRAPGGARNALAPKLKKEAGEARDAQREATKARTAANKLQDKALDTADKAIDKSHDANAEARLANKAQPFQGLENVHDAVDATRMDPARQREVLGFTSVADPKEAVSRDLQSLQRETDRGGREGAAELRRLMETHSDPSYRRELAQQAGPQVERISEAVNRDDDRMGSDDLKGTLRDLSRATVLAGPGQDGGVNIARSFAKNMKDDHLDIDDEDQFAGATRAVIEEGETPQEAQANSLFFGALHNELKAGDRNPEAQKEIAKAIGEGLNGRPGIVEQVADKANPVADALGGALNFAGDRVDDLNSVIPDMPGVDDALNAVIPGKDLPIPNFNPLDPSAALDLASGALHGTGDVVANTPEMAKAAATAAEYRSAIDQLGPNDKYTLGGGAKVAFNTVELGIKGKVEVTRERDWTPIAQNKGPDGKPFPPEMLREGPNGQLELKNAKPYVISVDGEASAGIFGTLGAKGGASTQGAGTSGSTPSAGGNVSGRAGGTLGGKVELRFESAAEAKRAMDIIAASGASGALAAGGGPVGPAAATLAQPVIDKVFGASAKDLPSLGKDLSAIEVRAGAYGELSGSLKGTPLGDLDGAVKADAKASVRVEFSDGKPTWLATRLDAGGELSATASDPTIGKKAPGRENGVLPDGRGAYSTTGGKTRFEGSVELRTPLKDGFDWKDLSGVTAAGMAFNEDTRAKVTLANETELNRVGTGGGVRSELEFHGEPNELRKSGALGHALNGNFNGALDSLERHQKDGGFMVAGRVLPYATLGVKGTIQANSAGTGATFDFEAGRRDYSAPLASHAGDVSTTRAALSRTLQDALSGVGSTGSPLDLRLPMTMRG
ncbi:MAG TPA: hypothetical protein VE153_28905 [Myxococcus sp.]|nr:hypothetical protein [Myxococcus sp.]